MQNRTATTSARCTVSDLPLLAAGKSFGLLLIQMRSSQHQMILRPWQMLFVKQLVRVMCLVAMLTIHLLHMAPLKEQGVDIYGY